MPVSQDLPISRVPVYLPRADLRKMLRLVKLTHSFSLNSEYQKLVFSQLPEVAHFDPGYAGLMMGYDFHLKSDGPQLIEVNTNAGGGYLAWLAYANYAQTDSQQLPKRLGEKLLAGFQQEWRDFSGSDKLLKQLVIVDETPEEQALYSEMEAIRDWLSGMGVMTEIVAPEQLETGDEGVFCNGRRVDLVYNRHCDFFLETPEMSDLKAAYLKHSVCLSPNPFVYGLLADKRRMILWSDIEKLAAMKLSADDQKLLLDLVPQSRLLADCDPQSVWEERKKLVFKPVSRFGSRGVLMGKSITRQRFAEQDPETTLIQQLALPGLTAGEEGETFKTDLRLYVYRDRLLGVAARLYQGQVTNLRTAGGGFAPVLLA